MRADEQRLGTALAQRAGGICVARREGREMAYSATRH